MNAHFGSEFLPILKELEHSPLMLVTVVGVSGSVPRECGAWMVVGRHEVWGTIGGGHLEWQATQWAREHGGVGLAEREVALGPALGQCCGGRVRLCFEPLTVADTRALAQRLEAQRFPVALFGGGHVGRALVRALLPLPFALWWIDSRDEIFPSDLSGNRLMGAKLRCEHSEPVQAAVADLPAQSRVLIMSFSHAEDLDVVQACLLRQRTQADLPFVGLIGSQTKWAVFQNRLRQRGFTDPELAHITCPIGVAGIRGKQPEVIAAAVAAQLLQACGL